MKKRQFGHFEYVLIAFATVLFWRATWNILDRLTSDRDSLAFDILTGGFGLVLLWYITRSFKHLD